jgi:hypothetical protein
VLFDLDESLYIIKRDIEFEKNIKDELLKAGFELNDGKWSIKIDELLSILYHKPEFFNNRLQLSEDSIARKISFLSPVFFKLKLTMPEGLN